MNFFERIVRFLFPRITQYRIQSSALELMRGFALQTHPKEMIALLRGHHEGDTLVVTELIFQPFQNTRSSATILLDPNITNIVGTFHSHPSPDARPSAADRRLFAKHPGIHLIAAWPYTAVHVYTQQTKFLGVEQIPGAMADVSRKGVRAGYRAR